MRALIVVDLQNDFMPGGALAVAHGDETVPIANALMPRFDLVVATQDWHPRDHGSFTLQHPGKQTGDVIKLGGLDQVLWPMHCVQESPGAEFHSDLDTSPISAIFRKGTDRDIDSYSGFFDNGHLKSTGLDVYLKERRVDTVYVMGLAVDYCVKYTALDAVRLGFTTLLIEDGCRGVGLKPGDIESALLELQAVGVKRVASKALRDRAA